MTDTANLLWSLLTNPNVAYLLLVVGVWSAALAYTVPGTGLAEAGASICLALAVIGLTRLPVNAAGLFLIGLSIVLFLVELKLATHGAFLIAGTAAFTLGSLFFFRPEERAGQVVVVSRWLVAGTSLATLVFFGWALSKALASQKAPPVHDPDSVVGAIGEARTDVDGAGSVYVGGELWSAEADEKITAGEEVVVLSRQGLMLKVAKKKERAQRADSKVQNP